MAKLILFLIGKFFALIMGGFNYKLLSFPYKLTFILIFLAAFVETLGFVIGYAPHQSNEWLFNCYMIVECWLIGSTAIFLVSNKIIKIIFTVLLVLNSIFWIVNIYNNTVFVFASSSLILGSIIYSLMYIMILFTNCLFVSKNTFSQPVFWLCLSTILYFGCDLPSMGLHNYFIQKNPTLGGQLVNINEILDFIRYPLLGISFILLGRPQKEPINSAKHVL